MFQTLFTKVAIFLLFISIAVGYSGPCLTNANGGDLPYRTSLSRIESENTWSALNAYVWRNPLLNFVIGNGNDPRNLKTIRFSFKDGENFFFYLRGGDSCYFNTPRLARDVVSIDVAEE